MEKDTKFEDADSYTFTDKKKLTFKEVVLLHLKKIGEYASVEFKGGYWEERPHPNIQINEVIKVYIPDSRECYSNAIEYLADILFSYFDKIMKSDWEKYEEEKNKLYEFYTEEAGMTRYYKKDEEGNKIRSRTAYRNERLNVNRKLFRALCSFLKRKNYLEIGAIED